MDSIFLASAPVHVEVVTLRRKAEPKQEPPPRKGRRAVPFVAREAKPASAPKQWR